MPCWRPTFLRAFLKRNLAAWVSSEILGLFPGERQDRFASLEFSVWYSLVSIGSMDPYLREASASRPLWEACRGLKLCPTISGPAPAELSSCLGRQASTDAMPGRAGSVAGDWTWFAPRNLRKIQTHSNTMRSHLRPGPLQPTFLAKSRKDSRGSRMCLLPRWPWPQFGCSFL